MCTGPQPRRSRELDLPVPVGALFADDEDGLFGSVPRATARNRSGVIAIDSLAGILDAAPWAFDVERVTQTDLLTMREPP